MGVAVGVTQRYAQWVSVEAQATPEPTPSSVGEEAEAVLRRASGGRLVAKLGVGLAAIGLLAVGGYFAYRSYEAREARSVVMLRFDGKSVRIGNDRRVREDFDQKLFEFPAHDVKIRSFEIDVNEVVVAHYRICVKHGACDKPVKSELCNYHADDRLDHPMNCVTQPQAQIYCEWVDKRLPTEVEWEYAAGGGGKKRLFPWGNKLPEKKHLNACGTECTHGAEMSTRALRNIIDQDDSFPTTAPVGAFEDGDTSDGMKDLAGNVFEWTSSKVCSYPEHTCGSGDMRIIRGGAWVNRYLLTFEVTTREQRLRTEPSEGVGFRCARDAQS